MEMKMAGDFNVRCRSDRLGSVSPEGSPSFELVTGPELVPVGLTNISFTLYKFSFAA